MRTMAGDNTVLPTASFIKRQLLLLDVQFTVSPHEQEGQTSGNADSNISHAKQKVTGCNKSIVLHSFQVHNVGILPVFFFVLFCN